MAARPFLRLPCPATLDLPEGPGARRMKFTARLLIAATLLFGSGCAKQDWIDRTLVTADVTGTWSGELLSRGSTGGVVQSSTVSLTLDQQASKVTGSFEVVASGAFTFQGRGAQRSGPIEGTVAGDRFSFRQTNGTLTGEMTVSGDEMTGYATVTGQYPMSLRRVGSSPAPSSK